MVDIVLDDGIKQCVVYSLCVRFCFASSRSGALETWSTAPHEAPLGTLRPNTVVWLRRRKRFMHGVEKLSLQGMGYSDLVGENSQMHHNKFGRIAGDMMNLYAYQVSFISLLCVVDLASL